VLEAPDRLGASWAMALVELAAMVVYMAAADDLTSYPMGFWMVPDRDCCYDAYQEEVVPVASGDPQGRYGSTPPCD